MTKGISMRPSFRPILLYVLLTVYSVWATAQSPVNTFPFLDDFETGFPQPQWSFTFLPESHIDIQDWAGNNSNYGLGLEGNTANNYGAAPNSGEQAYTPEKYTHIPIASINVDPQLINPGSLRLDFDLLQAYSFATNYSWFRVRVNGSVISDIQGKNYWQPNTGSNEWQNLSFDLSLFQNAPLIITFEASVKYHYQYYNEGDWSAIDNVKIWYELPPGRVTGTVYNGGGQTIAGATVGIENEGTTITNSIGAYTLNDVRVGKHAVHAWKEGYNLITDSVEVQTLLPATRDLTLTQPIIAIEPEAITEILNPNEYLSKFITLTNSGDGPLDWTALINYPDEQFRESGDLQFSFPVAVGDGESGAESDGVFLYTTKWNGDAFYKYDLNGNFVESFTCGEATNIRDLAWDGTYFYGAAASSTVYVMDFDNQSLISTFEAPVIVRGIAYDHDQDAFYANNWNTDISLFNISGNLINSFPIGTYGSYYGLAYDSWSDNGPFLWGFSQEGSGALIIQLELPTGEETGYSIDVLSLTSATQIAGGLFTQPNLISGKITLGGVVQNDLLFGIELAEGSPYNNWLTLDHYYGSIDPAAGTENIPIHFNAKGFDPGTVLTADLIISSEPDVGTFALPVSMTIVGDPMVTISNAAAELVNELSGQVNLSWDYTGDNTFQYFIIKRNDQVIGIPTANYFTDFLPSHGEYQYELTVVYDEGSTYATSPPPVYWYMPDLCLSPQNPEAWVWKGRRKEVIMGMQNCGNGELEFSFPDHAVQDLLNKPGVKGAGGPDQFGYSWIDSDEPGGPVYQFIDISETGTEVEGIDDDNHIGPFNFSFPFPFYGEEKLQYWINSNGVICFKDQYIVSTNTPIPTMSPVYNDFIAWYWDDLDPDDPEVHIYVQDFGTLYIIQFEHYYDYPDGEAWIDAQIILFPTGNIMINYDYLEPGFDDGLMTIGLQSSDPAMGLQVAYHTFYIHDELALYYTLPPHFIVDVNPAYGIIAEGESLEIQMIYSAEDYEPGDYEENLNVLTNALAPNDDLLIPNLMHIYTPAFLKGVVSDSYTNEPLSGAILSVNDQQVSTGPNGYYAMPIDSGTFSGVFSKIAYQNKVVNFPTLSTGDTLTMDIELDEVAYPPAWVSLNVNEEDTEAYIEWSLPFGAREIIYDDGEADDYFLWQNPENAHAVRYTPDAYPATIRGGKIYVGDGLFPPNASFLGTSIGVAIARDDGPDGMPGTVLDSTEVIIDQYNWITFEGFDVSIDEGDFYIMIMPGGASSTAPPIGVDYTAPTYYRSYSLDIAIGEWQLSPYQDMMIRAIVEQAESLSDQKRNAQSYNVYRFSNFDPEDPAVSGDTTLLLNTIFLSYTDEDWANLLPAWYAYGVQSVFPNGDRSAITESNKFVHGLLNQVTVNVSLSNDGDPAGTYITLEPLQYPDTALYGVVESGQSSAAITGVIEGFYDVFVYKTGFDTYELNNIYIEHNITLDVIMQEKKYPPRNLFVDALTSLASWDHPCVCLLDEDFEGETFPPEYWQSQTKGFGWYRTDEPGSENWPVPVWDSYVAESNSDKSGTVVNADLDYLLTPVLDLREAEAFLLSFDSYFDGGLGQTAYVEYSFDGGESWDVLHTMVPSGEWMHLELDISMISGENAEAETWLAFHADANGNAASGWAIDNVKVFDCLIGDWPPMGYNVYLDEAFVATINETTFFFENLVFGQEYTAEVGAVFSSGVSEKIEYTFTSAWLEPPVNLSGSTAQNAVFLEWYPPDNPSDNLLGFNVYRDNQYQTYIEWDQTVPIAHNQYNLSPGTYQYEVTAVYDITSYGYPGETAESAPEGPLGIEVSYGIELPFLEDWFYASFNANQWQKGCNNWKIDTINGQEAPSAIFTKDPVFAAPYSCALISYPLHTKLVTDGNIQLDFDLSLESNNDTASMERMVVKVWENGNWHLITQIHNSGDLDWTNYSFDITSISKGNDIKVGFFAQGIQSDRIEKWTIDNIHIYQWCPPPIDLTADAQEPGDQIIFLEWYSPEATYTEWTYYHDGNFENAIASNYGGEGLAQRFTPEHYPCTIKEIRFYVSDYAMSHQKEEVYILDGDGASILAGPWYYEGAEPGSWATIDIEDIEIASGDFMIATFNLYPNGPYIGIDESSYNGSLFYGTIGDFSDISNYGYYAVGSHEANIEYNLQGQRDILGYDIYRTLYDQNDWTKINSTLITQNYYSDTVDVLSWYSYYVTAVFDECASGPSNIVHVSDDPSGTVEYDEGRITIYPNPSNGQISISSIYPIEQIIIHNAFGEKISHSQLITHNSQLITHHSKLETGVYLITIVTTHTNTTHKITIIN